MAEGHGGTEKGTREFWVHCGDCPHEWVAFYTPIQLSLVSRFGKICCPKCASRKVLTNITLTQYNSSKLASANKTSLLGLPMPDLAIQNKREPTLGSMWSWTPLAGDPTSQLSFNQRDG